MIIGQQSNTRCRGKRFTNEEIPVTCLKIDVDSRIGQLPQLAGDNIDQWRRIVISNPGVK